MTVSVASSPRTIAESFVVAFSESSASFAPVSVAETVPLQAELFPASDQVSTEPSSPATFASSSVPAPRRFAASFV
ncbi:MAG: hypothetical protein IJO46_11180 [Thermoguttaceae bacterium]|nr:hypothetical protein [Thermoguttaceae bacterium]